ncbi:sugar transferase [Mucilaginibacter gotjawali]|uniref:Lipopolysaccharide/colanic/teichoic acid biosynthesis glycosyltransferase n=2 Tax=Mucilaginibacter gotjawali TaxID=1550579 RepID=A0A839SL75_9SPHI|nr:sugar transferase [Mucilaginibacter gotjawali]MBB3058148.1 lipopolysaccharide/colanic/teichoic acid biosynthesis glycosyltransferase [Mucilaginibacter gotjawali]BAU54897.1 UDP-glucose:undecaprenyl-phosphate glucose-1-phosphate transferase [Mucilaginibacter gotjawali]
MSENEIVPNGTPIIALVGFDNDQIEKFVNCDFRERVLVPFSNGMKMASAWQDNNLNIVAIISLSEIMAPSGLALIGALKQKKLTDVPFFLVVNHLNANLRQLALTSGIVDVFKAPLKTVKLEKRINFLIDNWDELKTNIHSANPENRGIGFWKRSFDLFFAGMALLMLSPVFLIIYLLIKLESKGPAFYYSLRVGTGYRVFKFFKFRSMYVNADQRLKDLKHLNQYNIDAAGEKADIAVKTGLCSECATFGKCQFPLFADNIQWCERDFIDNKKTSASSAFFKIKNDPRITKIGNFIRNTSIDELPQLWNVIIGDMSIVGNRPLPLYEAEKLTTDKYVLRFSAPAGITGLWQVEKRGKGEMSEEERLMLDNVYAQNHSFKNDLKLILKTIPALFQKENV